MSISSGMKKAEEGETKQKIPKQVPKEVVKEDLTSSTSNSYFLYLDTSSYR